MAKTFSDLEAEVEELRRRLSSVEGNPEAENQSTVDELDSNENDRSQPTRHGFADACAESRKAHLVELEANAIRELKGRHLSTPLEIRSFRARYSPLGRSLVDELINTHDPDGRR